MKILSIRGRNLASLEGSFELDFTVEPLLSAGIFAIAGPTGAGKSTILDAMCLALFGRTPRTEQAKENTVRVKDVNEDILPQSDPRFLLRRGTASGYAEVDFFAMNGFRYRARWSVMRAREKESGRLQQPRFTLHNLDKDQEEQGTRSDIQTRIIELIGLTFEQFTRSVLLAQNDFATFLKAEQGEKASLLEKLTGTELYSNISRLIYVKTSEAREEFEKIQRSIQGIELLTEEEEKEIRLWLAEAESSLQILEKKKAEKQILQDAVRSTQEQIRVKTEQQKQTTEKLHLSSGLLENARKEYEQCFWERMQTEKKFTELQPEFQTARILDAAIASELPSVETAEKSWKNALAKKKAGQKALLDIEKQQQVCETEIQQLKAWFEQYKEKEKIAEKIELLLSHLDDATKAYSEIQAINKRLAECSAKQGILKKKMEQQQKNISLFEEELRNVTEEIKKQDAQLNLISPADIGKELEAFRTQREQLLLEQARIITTGDIKTLRDNLQEGEPCPVCGSLHHPYASEEVNEKIILLVKHIAEKTKQIKAQEKRREEYTALQLRRNKCQEKGIRLQKQLTDAQSGYVADQHQQKLLERETEHYQRQCNERTESQQQKLGQIDILFGNSRWRTNWQSDPAQFRKTLEKFSLEWKEKKASLQANENQHIRLRSELESSRQFIQLHSRLVEEALKSYIDKKEVLAKKKEDRKQLLGGKAVEEMEISFRKQLETLTNRLDELQKTQNDQTANVEQLKGILEQINRDIHQANENLSNQSLRLEEWIKEYNQISGGVELEESIQQASRKRTEYVFRLLTQEENQKKIAGLQEELQHRRLISEQWAKLNDLAGSADGGKFRRIAQAYTLDVLLNYANVQLKSLTNRYKLERVPSTLALQVLDRDMCDEVRTVHSLSGGESFLVSLALALGLSSLSSNRMKVESLFIDEGFGSLDAETLRIAMDALESLRTQGRKIGVISHVQDMTERIQVQVEVCRSNNGRSYIRIK